MNAITDTVQFEQESDLYFSFSAKGDPEAQLVVTGFVVQERTSELYTIDLSLASRRATIDLTQLMDRPATLTIHDRYSQAKRYFHGVVESAEKGDTGLRYTTYHLTVRPSLHRLRYVTNSRIFQQKSYLDIVEQLLQEGGVSDYRFDITQRYDLKEYVTQYRETNLDFIERLLAETGLSYYFVHEENTHTLVMRDISIGARDCPEVSSLEYNPNAGGDVKGVYLRSFRWREHVAPTKVSYREHFYKNPNYDFAATDQMRANNGLTRELEIYDYPGRHKKDEVGKIFTQARMQHFRAQASHGEGMGRCQHLTAGLCVALEGHADESMNRKYLLVTVSHQGSQPSALEEDAGSSGGTFMTTHFACVKRETQWRSPLKNRPMVDGPQMAIVTGPPGEEIYCDADGRVKVYFPWDRYGKKDDTSSCWIRVAQNWAGTLFGHVALPRIGQHVIVDYLEGDPDQPIITGRAYNATNLPPYSLPDNKTKMVLKSKTHKGNGFNEMSFEDEKGREELYMHAQKDMTVKVLHDRNKQVDHDQTEKIGNDKSITVGANHMEAIALNKIMTVGLTHTEMVGINMMITVGIDRELAVGKNLHEAVGSNKTETIGDSSTESVTNHKHVHVGKNYYIDVGDELNMTAGKKITIQCGQSMITMTADGSINITGKVITKEASDKIVIKSDIVKVN